MPDPVRSASVLDKLRGTAAYASDLVRPGTAVAGIVRSPHAHARVIHVNAEAALAIPGVLGVLTARDFEGIRLGSEIADELVLAEEARYAGDHVAAVAAENDDALRLGLQAVEVEYEVLGAALSVGESDRVASTIEIDRGDWGVASHQVDVWAEGTFHIHPVHHAYMEPHAAVARYEPGKITLFAPTHSPARVREEYHAWFERIDERFVIKTPAFGGAFGAKYEHPFHLICAEFARRLRRDVAIGFSRREDFLAARPRVDMTLHVKIGATRDGRLIAKQCEVVANNGAYSLHGPSVLNAATMRMDNLYRYAAVMSRGRLVYTNTAPTECFRGFGDPEAAFAQEQLIDAIARHLGLDAAEIRRRNCVVEGDTSIHGWRITSSGLAQCIDWVSTRMSADRDENASSGGDGRFKVGYGLAPGMHVTSNRGRIPRDFARVSLRLRLDGTVELFSSEVDVGGGANRVLASLAADILELPADRVVVVLGDTEQGPDGLGSYASRTTFFAGNAVIDAAHRLKRLIDEGHTGELAVDGEYEAEDVEKPDPTEYGNRSPAYTFAVHGCKVAVDTWTGKTQVLRYWAAHDAGTVLDEAGARGQVYGGVTQGLGHALSEKAVLSTGGRMANPGFLDYRIPTALDSVPVEIMFSDTFDPGGPKGAKSLAEPPIIPVGACVANAIFDAVGVRLDQMPMDPETVLNAMAGALPSSQLLREA